jgi:hypothetical protein
MRSALAVVRIEPLIADSRIGPGQIGLEVSLFLAPHLLHTRCFATCGTCWEFLSGAMGTAGVSNPIHPVETAACANFAATPGKAPMVPKDPTREPLHGTDSWTSISPAAHTGTLERVRRYCSDCLADDLPIIKHSASSP